MKKILIAIVGAATATFFSPLIATPLTCDGARATESKSASYCQRSRWMTPELVAEVN